MQTIARTLRFPLGGLDKSRSFETQAPYTTPDCLNVLPYSQEDLRARGGSRPGLAKALQAELGDGSPVNMLARFTYVDDAEDRQEALMAASGGNLYRRLVGGDFVQVPSSLTLSSDALLQSADHLGNLYIADYSGTPLVGTDGTVDGTGLVFESATFANWTSEGVTANDYVVFVLDAGNGAPGVYQIDTVSGGEITLETSPGSTLTGVHFYVERIPKVYDPRANTLEKWRAEAGRGSIPPGNQCIARFMDRIVLAGGHADPHNWYMSRGGNARDWLYARDDALSAIAGTNADAGKVGEPINALITHTDECLIFGCENSLWVMRGNPAAGGRINNLSTDIGIIDSLAWCRTPERHTYFLSKDGMYRLGDPCGSLPEKVSRRKLPADLLFTDPVSVRTILAYDKLLEGIFITRTAL